MRRNGVGTISSMQAQTYTKRCLTIKEYSQCTQRIKDFKKGKVLQPTHPVLQSYTLPSEQKYSTTF